MGIFYKKFAEAAVANEVEDAIQTPDEIGVDLDAIEDGIVGKDGIEAHRDEVEDAEEGVVGDPVDEAFMIVYESEYNFNQMMKCIGIAELNEMAAGREFILEGANFNTFIENAKKFFVKMFESITRAFKKVYDTLVSACTTHKKFVKQNGAAVKAGFEQGEWNVKAYDLNLLAIKYQAQGSCAYGADIESRTNADVVKHVSGMEVANEGNVVAKMRDEMTKKYFVETEYSNANKNGLDVDKLLKILESNADMEEIKRAHKTIKLLYKENLAHFNRMKADFAKQDRKEDSEKVVKRINVAKFEMQCHNVAYAVAMKGYRARRAQAFKIAKKLVAAAPKVEAKTESTIFDFDII